MKSRSYNSVGAGDTPKCGVNGGSVEGTGRPATDGSGHDISQIKVSTDIPKGVRPGGFGQKAGAAPGMPPKTTAPARVTGSKGTAFTD